MKSNKLSKKFSSWFKDQYPDAVLFKNNKRKDELKEFDFISFHPKISCRAIKFKFKWWKIKTMKDEFNHSQIKLMNLLTKKGSKCFIVHELCKGSALMGKNIKYQPFSIEKWSVR